VAIVAISLTSCDKGKDPQPNETSYTLHYSISGVEYVTINLIVCESNEAGERIQNNPMDNARNGDSRRFVAHERTEKVKVFIEMETSFGSSVRWIQQVYYLTKHSNTDIYLTGETIIGSQEP
jgi:hypothetical protein